MSYKPFLTQREKIPVPKLSELVLEAAGVTNAAKCQAAYERHFNFWVNGSSRKHESKLGRFATRRLWQCGTDSLKVALLVDNVHYVEDMFRQLTKANMWELKPDIDESQRLAYLFDAEKSAKLIIQKLAQIYNDTESLGSETIFSSIGASGNFSWLKREIIAQGLQQMPGSAYEHVDSAGSKALNRIAKELFNWEPPTITLWLKTAKKSRKRKSSTSSDEQKRKNAMTDFERFKEDYANEQRLYGRNTDMSYKPFLAQPRKFPVPKLSKIVLKAAMVTNAATCQAAYERHFNFWVNGSSRKHESKLGRFVTRRLWQCPQNALKVAILTDNNRYLENMFRRLTKDTMWILKPTFDESLRLA